MIDAWHFVAMKDGKPVLRDGRALPAVGEWLEHEEEVVMCGSGLHASKKILDALSFAPGNYICRVQCEGDILQADDKLVSSHRRIVWGYDAEQELRLFARQCALDVIHLWDAPDIVRQFLETGDESIRAAASAAAWAASDAARYAASAASDAARAAARDARAAAWDASDARAAAWDASDAASDAARAAARDASAAARAAARDAQNNRLQKLIEEGHATRQTSA
jgi:hypothetical protein